MAVSSKKSVFGTAQLSLAEYKEQHRNDNLVFGKTTHSLGRANSSPYIKGHVLVFKDWEVTERNTDNGKELFVIPVFEDKTTGKTLNIWISYLFKTVVNRPTPTNEKDAEKDPTLWNTSEEITIGGDMGALVREAVNSQMTDEELMDAFYQCVTETDKNDATKRVPIEFVVKRIPYKFAQNLTDGRKIRRDADYVCFDKVTE